MQGHGTAAARPEAILEWLLKEMGYPSTPPSPEQLRKICRGNMVPVWSFLLQRVRSEHTVATVRRNMLVHGVAPAVGTAEVGRGRRREREEGSSAEAREVAIRERDLAQEEAERLRNVVRRQRKELKARMAEVAREESERKKMLDERSNARHKQVILEAYDQQCDEAAKIFAEYQRRLHHYIDQARDVRRLITSGNNDVTDELRTPGEKEVYSTVKGIRSLEDIVLVETSRERDTRKASEVLASHLIEKIRRTFPAYEGMGVNLNSQIDAAKLGIEFDGEIPEDAKAIVRDKLKNPSLLLKSITSCAMRDSTLIHKETEKIDIRADAELLRYKYENDMVLDAASPDSSSPLPYQVYGNSKVGTEIPTKATYDQLLERQKAHVQQFVATEDALNKAAEAKALCQKLLERLHGSNDMVALQTLPAGGTTQNLGAIHNFELEVLGREREVAGLRASLGTLTSEVQRLNNLCAEWKEAEDLLKKKWKKIEGFDARRSELENVYTALVKANMEAATFWEQQPLAARDHAAKTILPTCTAVVNISNNSKDLIERELSSFYQSLDNSIYMLPATPQELVESIGVPGATGPEAFAAAEKNAAILTTRAGARDPSAIPSICRISAALQFRSGVEGADAGLASVLESLEFCLKLRGSEANILEDLSKAINLVHTRRNLVENDCILLNHAHRMQQDYERVASYCLKLAGEQEKIVADRWLPELRKAVLDAQRCLENCQRVRCLVDEWWEQPAATAVDWVTVDGLNVGAWLNWVKQLQMAFYDQKLL
ncbi:AUGMIN subunit 5-like [Zingiber officinale]|uniref:AUGMIN subunit 5 n=1 Tax=Zingiber officinale TaxID=94328 RepID=A0A8J5KNK1_ZINOF|nr:AUGMIN subunit 5-like [Zingiber officinale]XP_042418904.1 AUGMIN subunit 5-like [Zingiber officinale]KAG6491266.1 hypothetical protein ZIOFF_052603 [Zingiber officinale]